MVTPINTGSVGLPTELVNIELPGSMARPKESVQASNETANTNTSTSHQFAKQQNLGTESSIDRTLEQINESMRAWSTGIRFSMDEDAGRLVISIVDSSTDEIIRTVPSDAVLRIAKMIVKLQGAAVNTKA